MFVLGGPGSVSLTMQVLLFEISLTDVGKHVVFALAMFSARAIAMDRVRTDPHLRTR